MRTCQLPQRAFQGDIVGARPSIRHAPARVQNPGQYAKASRVVICRAHEQDPQLSHEAKGVYRLLRQKQTIGAEHGEVSTTAFDTCTAVSEACVIHKRGMLLSLQILCDQLWAAVLYRATYMQQ